MINNTIVELEQKTYQEDESAEVPPPVIVAYNVSCAMRCEQAYCTFRYNIRELSKIAEGRGVNG